MNEISSTPSAKFRAFAIVFAISGAALYVLCDMRGWPLFSYHPATGRMEFGYAPPRLNEGPVMYWYGWTATTLIGATVLGFIATLLPESLTRKMPLSLVWLAPLLAIPPLIYSLMPFWTK